MVLILCRLKKPWSPNDPEALSTAIRDPLQVTTSATGGICQQIGTSHSSYLPSLQVQVCDISSYCLPCLGTLLRMFALKYQCKEYSPSTRKYLSRSECGVFLKDLPSHPFPSHIFLHSHLFFMELGRYNHGPSRLRRSFQETSSQGSPPIHHHCCSR